MTAVLVDTNIIIDYLRRKDKQNSLFFKVFGQRKNKAIVSATTVTELWAGKSMARKKVFQRVKGIIDKCKIIMPDLETSRLAGEILRKTDCQIAFQDAQIAALALRNKLPLLTLNEKDFQSIKGVALFQPDN